MTERIAAQAESTSLIVERPAWSPAQVFGVAGGVVLIVIGAIGLAHTGTNFSSIPLSHATAAGLHFTCLSAVVQLGVGVLLLGACVFPDSAKSAMATFGVLLVVWGIVIAADTTRLFTMWGYTKGTGIFYIVVGAVLVLTAALSPIFFSSRREVSRQSRATTDATANPRSV
jgi:hypothetical protein